jgi:hypothetical protein
MRLKDYIEMEYTRANFNRPGVYLRKRVNHLKAIGLVLR